jgi:hypothetical protein
VRNLNCVKTAVASLVLGSTAVVWASPPEFMYGTSTIALESGPIAITTTLPATYVVAAEANASNDLEVIAWHDTGVAKTGLVNAGTPGVLDGPGLVSVGITGLDSSHVVTADIDVTGTLSINTWIIGGTAVLPLKGNSTPANTVYHNVAIATLSPTEVVTAYQLLSSSGGASLAVEEWTIAADGFPTPEGAIAFLPLAAAAADINEVSIATVNSNEVVTAANDTNDDLLVATWAVDSAGVHYQDSAPPLSNTAGRGEENLGIGAGSTFRFQDHFPYLETIQSAFTPVLYGGQVAVIYWGISATGGLTQKNIPVWTTTPGDSNFEVAACMVEGKVPITIWGNDDGFVDLELYPNSSSFATYSASPNVNQYGITSIASAAAGGSAPLPPFGFYNGYFVTAVLTHFPANAPSAVVNNNLEIKKWSSPVEPTLF